MNTLRIVSALALAAAISAPLAAEAQNLTASVAPGGYRTEQAPAKSYTPAPVSLSDLQAGPTLQSRLAWLPHLFAHNRVTNSGAAVRTID